MSYGYVFFFNTRVVYLIIFDVNIVLLSLLQRYLFTKSLFFLCFLEYIILLEE